MGDQGSDDESSEDEAVADSTSVQQLLRARLEEGDASSGEDDDGAQEPPAAASDPAASTESSGPPPLLPSALDALDPTLATPDFLHVAGPEFDASKDFKPPPVTAADFGPVIDRHLRDAPKAGDVQRAHREFDWGRSGAPEGQVRLHGSVCRETDDERGRRVKYGAHAMLKADPWSACNPNFAMNDSSVTRGKDRGGKRRLGE